ncbi:phage antirepressor [Rummeliibacillus sp. BSL5]
MNQLQMFNFENQKIRIIDKEGEPWFVGKDVANVLGYSDTYGALKKHVDLEDKQNCQNSSFESNRGLTIINESGMYSLVLSSKLESARRFKRWVTSEVIPSIRKHGTYMTTDTIEKVLTDPDTIIKIATQLKEEQAKRMAAEAQVERQKPKVLFASAVEASETSILIGQLAKIITQNGIKIGQNRLFEWMRENGYLGKKGSHYNEPTQYAMERGWFEVTERTFNNPDGSIRVTRTTKVTGKGQVYFINKILHGIAV